MGEYHPDKEALESFARGEILAAAEGWIVDHIRSGCVICQRTVDALLPRLEGSAAAHVQPPPLQETLEPLPFGRNPQIRAASPQGLALGTVAADRAVKARGIEAGAPRRSPDDDAASLDRIRVKLEQRLALLDRERDGAPRLLAELLQLPAAERMPLLRIGRRFWTYALCDLLLDRSFDTAYRDSAEAVALAELGILLADHLDSDYYGSAVIHDMKARGGAYLGTARRIGSDFAGAEQALAFAESLAEDGSADPLEEARLLDLKASLLADQGWFEEAARLLGTVIDIYDEVKDLHRKGRALISRGIYLGYAGWPQQAIKLIPEGLALLDRELEPRLALTARHSLAWFLNDCGHLDRAQRLLDGVRQSYELFGDAGAELRLEWLQARIARRAGRSQEAEQRFRLLLPQFIERGLAYEASIAMLDLAALYLEQGQRSEIRGLADEMLPIFLAQDIHRHAVAALMAFQQAAAADRMSSVLLGEIASYLQRARKNPRLSFQRAA